MQILRNFYLSLVILLGIGCSAPLILQSHWVPREADSRNLFEQTPANFLFPKDDISLKIFNNQGTLDLIFETNSPQTIEKIIRLGLSVWIDPSGNKAKGMGVYFPLPLEDQSSFSVNFDPQFITNHQLNQIYQNLNELELVNFVPNETLSISRMEKGEGVTINLYSIENKLFRYHLSINLNRILSPDKPISTTKLSIGISSVNEPNEEYYSALSSRRVIQKKMNQLRAGEISEDEISEHWVTFQLASP